MKSTQTTGKTTKSIGLVCLLGAACLFASAGVNAEQITIPLGQQGRVWNVESPRTGMSKVQVEQQFGSPIKKSGPVGDPPIYTWEYDKFQVYFEGDYVIHSVVKFQPQEN